MQNFIEEKIDKTQEHLSKLSDILENNGEMRSIKRMLNGLKPIEISQLLESSPPPSRKVLWTMVEEDIRGAVLQEIPDELTGQILKTMNTQQVADITNDLDADDAADILQQLPNRIIQEVLQAMSEQSRSRVETVLSYEEDTAGGLMNTDIITIRPPFTLDVVIRYLRRHDEIPPSTDQLFVVNQDDVFLGTLSMNKLLTSDPNISVREIMRTDTEALPVNMKDNEVAQLFEQNDWVSAAVINEQQQIVGRITIDDVVDVIIEEADHSLMSLAGLDDDEDTFAPLIRTTPRRAIWLGVNLLTAILASSVINLFQGTIDKVVALAVLMPIVASMGGIAGSQTLAIVIRGTALGKIGPSNQHWLLSREILSGLFNGILWAVVLGSITSWWFDDIYMAMIIGVATVINLVTAAVGGTLLPPFLKKMGIDPALAAGVALTTLTDVVGFMAFLGLATLFYA
ncbi:magnesium transporter [Candidatus Endobugula sertula]|uniref:Magnesium transporter MgtE n=1 Tax=Candidatus Endobugula sertula TaxID=62101 RepID=A0A1D2QQN1_9GAMM|nr:magnesium transporter [Candidatus Endobugula sertula]